MTTQPSTPDRTLQWAELTPLVNRLDELKAAVERTEGTTLSDQKFADRFLAFSATTWSKVKSATYAGSLTTVADKCRAAIDTIQAQLPALAETARFAQTFVLTQLARAANAAVFDDGGKADVAALDILVNFRVDLFQFLKIGNRLLVLRYGNMIYPFSAL